MFCHPYPQYGPVMSRCSLMWMCESLQKVFFFLFVQKMSEVKCENYDCIKVMCIFIRFTAESLAYILQRFCLLQTLKIKNFCLVKYPNKKKQQKRHIKTHMPLRKIIQNENFILIPNFALGVSIFYPKQDKKILVF